jgi:rubrerythrin
MLQQDLALEKEALAAYTRAWELAEGNFPLRLMLESFIEEEQSHVEDMEKIVNKLTIAVADGEKEIKLQRAS